MVDLYGKDFITTQDWSVDELAHAIKVARKLKDIVHKGGRPPRVLDRKNFFMLFYAPSTRTRGAFEAATSILGGHPAFIDVSTTRMEEAVKDAARMYDSYADGIGVRILDKYIDFVYGAGYRVVAEFARVAKVPVINMACCTYHPTQGLGDIMTVENKLGKLKGKKYTITWAYSSKPRGRCSIQEEVLIASRFGMDVVLAHPKGFDIDPKIIEAAKRNARESGGSFKISNDFEGGLEGANVVFPRSWGTSEFLRVGATKFGVDKEAAIYNKHKDWRLEQRHVDDLMAKPAIVTHVLPVMRGEEATDEVMDGPNSVIYEQADDNFYAKMASIALTMAKEVPL
ncbi:MAG: ornithine carbamoyltransferase [Hadesarchaea archaeon]|nr:ornithine carbamoyltransferase [Hadesarchaea archaeon]